MTLIISHDGKARRFPFVPGCLLKGATVELMPLDERTSHSGAEDYKPFFKCVFPFEK